MKYMDVFHNPVAHRAYSFSRLAGYPVISGLLPFTLRAALCAFKFTPGKFVREYDVNFFLEFHVRWLLRFIKSL
jgi:hypothetical protein